MTTADIEALNLGYLTGADLLQFCAPQLLISRFNMNNSNLLRGCQFAYSEIIRNLSNRYDVTDELKNTGVIAATAAAVQTGGVINQINFTPGIGYATAPVVVITDGGPGTGAAATAALTGTSLGSIIIGSGGTGYTSPVISLTGGLGIDKRENFLVQITAVIAIRKILGSLEKLSTEMKDNFTWAENSLMDIRNGQMNLILPEASKIQASTSELICARFKTIG